jgi:hypothetical protein
MSWDGRGRPFLSAGWWDTELYLRNGGAALVRTRPAGCAPSPEEHRSDHCKQGSPDANNVNTPS